MLLDYVILLEWSNISGITLTELHYIIILHNVNGLSLWYLTRITLCYGNEIMKLF